MTIPGRLRMTLSKKRDGREYIFVILIVSVDGIAVVKITFCLSRRLIKSGRLIHYERERINRNMMKIATNSGLFIFRFFHIQQ